MIDYGARGAVQTETVPLQNHAGLEIRLFWRGDRPEEWLILRHAVGYNDPQPYSIHDEFRAATEDPASHANEPGYTYSVGCSGAVALNPCRTTST